jgi:succinoglycan biosynthesis protein ExoW
VSESTSAAAPAKAPAPVLAVVIPYFQRQPGLLQACVRSVLAQRGVPPCHVIVVDDSSPHPAATELDGLAALHPNVVVFRQANAGPGAARNRGLDLVPAGTRFVAFLDSDDTWTEHLAADALTAFEHGADLFFANSSRYGADKPRFEWAASNAWQLEPQRHPAIDELRGLRLFDGDFFDFAVRRSGIISTSTLAYRFERFPALRFNTQLFNGQDRFFKLELAKLASRAAFSTRLGATEGQGINIFDSSQWGSSRSLTLLFNYIRLQRLILARIVLSPTQRDFVRGQLARTRRDLASTVLHMLRARTAFQPGLLRRIFAADPMSALMFMPNLVRALWTKLAAPRTTDPTKEANDVR